MRKFTNLILSMFIFFACFSMIVSAETYALSNTDITIDINDPSWYVFTRDNMKDHPSMEKLDFSYEEMNEYFINNNVYMDAFVQYDNGGIFELIVRKADAGSEYANLSELDEKDINALAEKMAQIQSNSNHTIYENTYKFIKFEFSEFKDTNITQYVCTYYTSVNGDMYELNFQSFRPSPTCKRKKLKL